MWATRGWGAKLWGLRGLKRTGRIRRIFAAPEISAICLKWQNNRNRLVWSPAVSCRRQQLLPGIAYLPAATKVCKQPVLRGAAAAGWCLGVPITEIRTPRSVSR
jgi:hypothetical protein